MAANRDSPSAPRRVLARLRDLRAVEMRAQGMTFAKIAAELGCSDQTAAKAVRRGLELAVHEWREEGAADRMRAREEATMQTAQAALMPKVLAGDTQAVNALVRILEHRARLFGLELPRSVGEAAQLRVIVELPGGGAPPDVIDGEAEELPALGTGE